jgi:heme-degrading monooxygenase HmoA
MATSDATVMRTWTGWISTTNRESYRDYIAQTGLSEYRTTPGNRGAWMVYRDLDDGRTEVVTVSLWESRQSITAFAGKDIDRAVFYPDDDRYLVDRETFVRHFDIVG